MKTCRGVSCKTPPGYGQERSRKTEDRSRNIDNALHAPCAWCRASQKGRRGFTLVEVLTAVVILGFGLTTLLTAASRSLATLRMSKQYQDALGSLNAGEALWPLVVSDDLTEQAVGPETLENGHRFERRIEETEVEGLYIVRTTVTWSEHGRQGREELVRYVLSRTE